MTDEELKTLQEGEKRALKNEKIPGKPKTSNGTEPKPRVQECQPTSSTVKMEDLVTDEQEKHQDQQDNAQTNQSTRSFWDRPIPRPQYDWPHDPRMPDEWNAVVTAMRACEGNRITPRGETYRQPDEDEISEPEEVMGRQPIDPMRTDHIRKQESV